MSTEAVGNARHCEAVNFLKHPIPKTQPKQSENN